MRPLTLAATGLDHWPCSTCSPAPIARQTNFARVLVHCDQTWGARRWDARMAFILAVGGRDQQQITHGQHFAVGGFMRKHTQAAAHVQLPGDVGRSVVLEDLFPIWTTVLAIEETLRVEATELAFGGDIVQTVTFHIRCTCRRRQQELPQAALHSSGPRPAKGTRHPSLEKP